MRRGAVAAPEGCRFQRIAMLEILAALRAVEPLEHLGETLEVDRCRSGTAAGLRKCTSVLRVDSRRRWLLPTFQPRAPEPRRVVGGRRFGAGPRRRQFDARHGRVPATERAWTLSRSHVPLSMYLEVCHLRNPGATQPT
jgi:hypothetical protein